MTACPLRLPAEWEPQDGVLMAWPHEKTDWFGQLEETQRVFTEIIAAVTRFEPVVLIVPATAPVTATLTAAGIDSGRLRFYELPCDDTWARDFGPIGLTTPTGPQLLDFGFNGWGGKFPAHQDNELSRRLQQSGAFGATPVETIPLILEGGSIESDGNGTLMTTSRCLLEEHRNPHLSRQQLETHLHELLGIAQVLWLDHGALQGDDTDSHIDTLARFAPDDIILYQGCGDASDPHYTELAAMREQLATFRNTTGHPYRLIELPWPQACYDEEGQRLPATYANFLVINGAVLVPTYDDPADSAALQVVAQAFPEREVIPVGCRALIAQHGSLHCVTMQLFEGVLA